MAIESVNNMINTQTVIPTAGVTKSAAEYTDVSIAEVNKKPEPTAKSADQSESTNDSSNREASKETLHQTVESLNKTMTNSELQFGIHESTNRVTIKIIDKDTKEVIKELPPEKTLDLIAKAWELAGIMVDERR